jgi:RNA polymerase sigma-70 factor (ECF subfamily)
MDPRTWLKQHGDYLYRFALARVRRTDAAEDLVQETLLAAWKGRTDFASQASERTWLTAILKRKVVDWLRKRIREQFHTTVCVDTDRFATELFTHRGIWKAQPGRWDRGDPAGPLDQQEFWATLNACLDKLPARLHDAFVLRYVDEAACEEVCQELKLTPSNLWVMLHRARLRMWWCLSRNWFGEDPQAGGLNP